MAIITSIYDRQPDDANNRLLFWLQLGTWSLNEAAAILANIDYSSIRWNSRRDRFDSLKKLSGEVIPPSEGDDEETVDDDDDWAVDDDDASYADTAGTPEDLSQVQKYIENQLQSETRKYQDLRRILGGADEKPAIAPVEDWIGRMRQRKLHIPWLAWAQYAEWLPNSLDRSSHASGSMQAQEANGEGDSAHGPSKNGTARRRNTSTHLKMIAALCHIAELDLDHPFKAGTPIKMTLEHFGMNLSDQTIADVLREAKKLQRGI